MMNVSEASGLVKDFSGMLSKLRELVRKGSTVEGRIKITAALTAIQAASLRTKTFISQHGYVSNQELTELWLIAMKQTIAAGITEPLPESLYHKGQFWSDPQQWIKEPASMELVPKLKRINEQCDALLQKLKS